MLTVCYFRLSVGLPLYTVRLQYVSRGRPRPSRSQGGFKLNPMANPTLQRAIWSLQILRTSRQIPVLFPSAFHGIVRSRNLSEEAARSSSQNISPCSSPRLGLTRSVFTSTKLRQDLEAKETADSKVHRNHSTSIQPQIP